MTAIPLCVATHVACIDGKEYDGIGNSLRLTLNAMDVDYLFIKQSMDGLLPSVVEQYQNGKISGKTTLAVRRSPSVVRYISEVRQTVKYLSTHASVGVFIGVDPLNALAGILLKRRGKVKKTIFFTADYSPRRFSNPLLNKLYHFIDRYCVLHADEVWSVSTRIVEVRKSMGLADEKNIFVPNVPPNLPSSDLPATHDKYELITTGIIDTQLDFEGAIRAVQQLSGEYPQLHLTIIGNGPEQARLEKLANELGISEKVEFTGRLPLEQALARQSRAGIGLALYTGVWGFNHYGDSTKCREFFSFGLPVISTDTHATVEELKTHGAGIVVKKDPIDYVEAIRTILAQYDEYSARSNELGTLHQGAHQKQFERLLSDNN